MMRKGSVTVFLALVLSLMLSLVCTSVESVRMAAARTQILGSLDVGLYSLFGQYDSTLLKEYDLFLLDGSCGGSTLNMAGIYDNMKFYMEPVLKQNSQKLSIVQGGFSGYRLATDEDGEAFYHQVVQYMKETLGSQGIQLLLNKMKDRQKKTEEAEVSGNQAEQGKMLESYESEMDSAARNSQAAQEKAQQEHSTESQGEVFGSGPGDSGGGSGFSSNADQNVANPVTVIQRIRKMGILQLVLPPGRSVSDKKISKKTLVSGRTLQQGFGFAETLKKDTSYTSQLLFQQYLMDKLGNFRRPSSHGLRYQVEYILEGKDNDLDNLKAVAGRLLIIREGVNFAHLLSEPGKRSQAAALAAAIAATFLIPPAASVIEKAVLLCWAFGESILDVRELLKELSENNTVISSLEEKLETVAANINESSERFRTRIQEIEEETAESRRLLKQRNELLSESYQTYLLDRLNERKARKSHILSLLKSKTEAFITEIGDLIESGISENEQVKLSLYKKELAELHENLERIELSVKSRKTKDYKKVASIIRRNPSATSVKFSESFHELKLFYTFRRKGDMK